MALTRRSLLALVATSAGVALLPSEAEAKPEFYTFGHSTANLELPRERKRRRMAKLFGEIECWDDRVERIWVHPRTALEFPAVFGDAFDQHGRKVVPRFC